MDNEENRKRMIVVGSIAFVFLIIVVSVVFMVIQWVNHQNEIVSIKNYPASMPGNIKDDLETQLRNVLGLGVSLDEAGFIDGEVREGTYQNLLDSGINTSTFLLDIDKYQQTFLVSASWSDEIEIPNPILISCPDTDLMKYPDTKCLAMYDDTQSSDNLSEYPLYDVLPIIIDEFNFSKRENIHYELRGYFNSDNNLVIVIKDYSGDNYNNALGKIREAGYSPEDYIIEYVDESGSY